jgi:hypothetical protein
VVARDADPAASKAVKELPAAKAAAKAAEEVGCGVRLLPSAASENEERSSRPRARTKSSVGADGSE